MPYFHLNSIAREDIHSVSQNELCTSLETLHRNGMEESDYLETIVPKNETTHP
jgi:hypothetical protein